MDSTTPTGDPARKICDPSQAIEMVDSVEPQPLGCSSEDLSKRGRVREKEHVSPPPGLVEAVSPVSSKGRASAGRSRGLGNPSPGFGAGVPRIPPPIFTSVARPSSEAVYSQHVREPFPVAPLPSIGETMQIDHNHKTQATAQDQWIYPIPHEARANKVTGASPYNPIEVEEHRQDYGDVGSQDPIDANPYAHRADEIGPSHHIKGIGHLGDLLQPPGWSKGHEPIDPRKARMLFGEARLEAKKTLKQNMDKIRILPAEEQEKQSLERDRKWDSEFRLSQLLLVERIKVYDMYQARKRAAMETESLQKPDLPRMPTHLPPLPLNSPVPVSNSARLYPGYSSSPGLYASSAVHNGGPYFDRGQPVSRSYPPISPGFISPSNLDPSLMMGSFQAVYQTYQNNQNRISQMTANNDRALSDWLARYGPHFSQSQILPGVLAPVTGKPTKAFFNNHNAYVSRDDVGRSIEVIPRPPPYQSPTSLRYEVSGNPYPNPYDVPAMGPPGTTPRWSQAELPLPNPQSLGQGDPRGTPSASQHDLESQRPTAKKLGQQPDNQSNGSSPHKSSPQNKTGVNKPRPLKPKPWYQEEVDKANLPTSVISEEALQAGRDFVENGGGVQNPKTTKSRRNKPQIDPRKGLVVSKAAAKLLIASGATDNTGRSAPVAAPMPVLENRSNPSISYPDGLSGNGSQYMPRPANETNFVISRGNQEEARPESELSSGSVDDPKDENFGKRNNRRKAATPRKNPGRKAATPIKKRKSDGTPLPNKRSRPNVDGPGDEHEDNLEICDDFGMTPFSPSGRCMRNS